MGVRVLQKLWRTYRSWPTWVQVTVALIILVGVGSTSGGGSNTSPDRRPGENEDVEKAPELRAEEDEDDEEVAPCSKVSRFFITNYLENSLRVNQDADNEEITEAFTVRSEDYPGGPGAPIWERSSVWFVAAQLKSGVAVWATTDDPTTSSEGAVTLVATNDVAEKFSIAGIDLDRSARPPESAHGVAEAQSCAEA